MGTRVGECIYCDDGIVEYESKNVRGKKTKVYCCSNNKVTTVDEGESWERTEDSTCSFKIFGNSLERWGKKFIGPKEVKKLLDGEDVIVHMYSYQKKVEYKKYIALDETYGVSVLWELDVEEEDDEELEENDVKETPKKITPKKEPSLKSKPKIVEQKPEKRTKPIKKTITKKDTNSSSFDGEEFAKSILGDVESTRSKLEKPKEIQANKSYEKPLKKEFIKPVFVNKKYTDEGAAF